MTPSTYWTNPSVLSMAGTKDPISEITKKARTLILGFIESGGKGPPFDPFDLANYMKVNIVPNKEVGDARTIFMHGRFNVEFNPNRANSRVRYSISHELAHVLFPDCKQEIRNRATHEEMRSDEWQLEMLCNVGASELLMPIGTFPDLQGQDITIDNLLNLRSTYEVSMEALMLRVIRLTDQPCAVFSASRKSEEKDRYKIDYFIPSQTLSARMAFGTLLPADSVISECTAIGFTAKANELWPARLGEVRVESVGIPPYPSQTYPRVMGIVKPRKPMVCRSNHPTIVKGDATRPRGAGKRTLAYVVNDKTPRWGAGFALEVKKKWPSVQDDFVRWTSRFPEQFRLGSVHLAELESGIRVAQLICQHGYGPSATPRIRYSALRECLERLGDAALDQDSSIHMPRIGSGEAGGNWSIIHEMIEDVLTKRGVQVTIYELPNEKRHKNAQLGLSFSS